MSKTDSERLEAELLGIRQAMKGLGGAHFTPQVFTPKEAAKQLSIGLTTFRAMIKAGRIELTAPIGGVRMVAVSEIKRLALLHRVSTRTGGRNDAC